MIEEPGNHPGDGPLSLWSSILHSELDFCVLSVQIPA